MNDAAGSPLLARQNPFAYLVLVFLAIAIGIIFCLYILSKIIQKYHQSPEYIEKQKQKITTVKDIQTVSKILTLSKAEAAILWRICKNWSAPNIVYSYTDEKFLDRIFKQEYLSMKKNNADDKAFLDLFHLRFHIYKSINFELSLSSSHNIPLETLMSFPAPSGLQYQFTLIQNDKNGLLLKVPETLEENSTDRPNKLEKIAMVFSIPNGQQYAVVLRVVQFLKKESGEEVLSVTHSNALCLQGRRSSMRITVNRDCSFSAVEITHGKKDELIFKPKENCYNGTIVDISEGGCKIFTALPIKKGQYLYIRFNVKDELKGFFGQIVDTRTDYDSGLYSIHVCFKQLTLKDKVSILSDIYDWD